MAENKFNFNVKKPKPGKAIFLVIIAIIVVVVIIGLFSSFYSIDETELGILIRFGKVIDGNVRPGLKFKLPFVDEVEIVDVSSKKAEFGFRTADASLQRTTYIKGEQEEQVSRMLTGDLNIADVEWVVQYYVNEPYKYVFEIENADDTLRDLSESIMRRFIGNRSLLEEIITTEQEGATDDLEIELKDELQMEMDNLNSGILISDVYIQNLKNANDPEVEAAFTKVVSAEQEQQTIIEEAQEIQSRIQNEVRGEAASIVSKARGYKEERINRARGDVAQFKELYNRYKDYPEITRKRMYIETISKLYTELEKITIVDSEIMDTTLPLLNLNKEGGNQ
jgi:membrane protease subunit HflK